MKSFAQFILEGGNVKVAGGQAAPFKVTALSRQKRVQDIHAALGALHHSFHQEHGQELFKGGKPAYSGSSHHLMDKKLSDEEFAKHKPEVGDVDVQIHKDHGDKLHAHLTTGRRFGPYTVVGTKKHGSEISAVMRHDNGEHHQFDFEKTSHDHESNHFLHSADWEDTKAGIKGVHHKMLINAVGGSTHKFSITHGLRSRDDESDPGVTHPKDVTKRLFGDRADHTKIHSFKGVAHLIRTHIPAAHHQDIYDKMKDSCDKKKNTEHGPALAHLRKALGVKHTISETLNEEAEHHASVIPLVGFSPISHMGHAHDLGGALKKLPGKKHIGISNKADVFSPEERSHIMKKQWGDKDVTHHFSSSGGEVISKAYHSLPKGKKHLHILVGHDRKDMADKLKGALENGKIKEMNGHKWDSIHVHTPEDSDRTHGMSGTNLRKAAHEGNHEEFHRHLGHMFSKEESKGIMHKVKKGLDEGKIKLKR